MKGALKNYESLFASLQATEERIVRTAPGAPKGIEIGLRIPLTVGEVAFVAEEIYRGRSAISGLSTRLHLARWRRPQESTLKTLGEGADVQKWSAVRMSDLVCLTKEELKEHDKLVLKGDKTPEELYDAETVARVESRIAEIKEWEKHR